MGGHGEAEVNRAWHAIREGSVFLYRPGLPWRMRGTGSETLRKFFVVFDGAEGGLTGPGNEQRLPFRFEPLWELVALLETLEREAGHPSSERQSICNALLQAILLKLCSHDSLPEASSSRSQQTFLQAARFIEERFRSLRNAGEIATGVYYYVVENLLEGGNKGKLQRGTFMVIR